MVTYIEAGLVLCKRMQKDGDFRTLSISLLKLDNFIIFFNIKVAGIMVCKEYILLFRLFIFSIHSP